MTTLLFASLQAAALPPQNGNQQPAAKTQPKKTKGAQPFRIFSPESIAKPTGYSHVAEVNGGKNAYIAGQVALDKSANLSGKDAFRAHGQQVIENPKPA